MYGPARRLTEFFEGIWRQTAYEIALRNSLLATESRSCRISSHWCIQSIQSTDVIPRLQRGDEARHQHAPRICGEIPGVRNQEAVWRKSAPCSSRTATLETSNGAVAKGFCFAALRVQSTAESFSNRVLESIWKFVYPWIISSADDTHRWHWCDEETQ